MSTRASSPRLPTLVLLAAAAAGTTAVPLHAQRGPEGNPRAAAPIDLTGNWVSVINEDWRWRMVTPPKGDYASVPLNDRGREVADTWDPSQDGSCKAYGAAGLMRMPTRLRIRWDGNDVLEIQTDAGRQTRQLHFGGTAGSAGPSLQGTSVAEWQVPTINTRGGRGPDPTDEFENIGTLKVETTNLEPGWLRRNGVPYSDQTTMTEYFSRFTSPDENEWFVVTTIVRDPVYLRGEFVTSSHFRRETGGNGWNPRACAAAD